ncbi:ABC transporter substrate-binding protein [Chelativorans xinjiangense]|uniref:ABC transporter substrate-binding protein n=1 Tax=Chelativorans xinjiangense TaxID=2681485 RepID=UPI001358196C|nr:ABC transporter substrate-binding protein [Chelativorans xinjiangense]
MLQEGISRRDLMLGAGVLTAGCLTGEVIYAQGRTILRSRNKADIESLDPLTMGTTQEREVMTATLPRLARVVTTGGAYDWEPSVYVESFEIVDDTTIAFKLKPGFNWSSDFGELTAEDVKYSFERAKGDSQWKDKWAAFDRVEVTGEYSGNIVLAYPFPAFTLTVLAHGMACVVSRAAVEAAGGKYTVEMPATCGPYMVKEWIPKQRMSLVPDPQWPGEKPDFDEVQAILVAEITAAELAYEAGELDVTQISPEGFLRYEEALPAGSAIANAGHLNYAWLGMNTEHPKLSDIRVRKAIQHAIDVDTALQAGFSGSVIKANGIIPPGLAGHREKSGYDYDPEKARAVLAEAGVSGLELDLKTMNLPERLVIAQVFQANLAAVGIKVNIIPLEVGTYWNQGREKKGEEWKDLQIYLTRFGGGLDPSGYVNWFVKEQIGNWNWERWTDPEFEELYLAAAKESDTEKRAEMYLRMQQIMEDTGAYVWLWHDPESFIHRTAIVPSIVPGGEFEYAYFKKA